MKLTREYKREKLEGVVREHRMKFGNQQNGPVMGGKIYGFFSMHRLWSFSFGSTRVYFKSER